MNKTIEINDANINELLNNNPIVLIAFKAEWCGPCRMLEPIIDKLASEETDIIVGKLNVDGNQESVTKYMISGIPTIVFFKDGMEVNRIKGMVLEPMLRSEIKKLKT